MTKKTKHQDESLRFCKQCKAQKKLYKKIFGSVSSAFLFFTIGLFISIAVLTVYAAWGDPVSPGDPLTSAKWNEVINQIKSMETEMNSNWKILAQGSDLTEEALITLQNTGTSFETDHGWADQRVNIGTFNWPPNKVNEITFRVNNHDDGYCVGGDFNLQLAAAEPFGPCGNVTCCQDIGCQNTTCIKTNKPEDDGIKIAINGVDMNYCPDQYGRVSTDPSYKGRWGYPDSTSWRWDVLCYYKAGVDYASSTITKIEVKELDHSPQYGAWNWEIWYK